MNDTHALLAEIEHYLCNRKPREGERLLAAAARALRTQQEALTLIANGTQFMRPDAVARAAIAKVTTLRQRTVPASRK